MRTLPTDDDLLAIREGVRAACAPFGDDYFCRGVKGIAAVEQSSGRR